MGNGTITKPPKGFVLDEPTRPTDPPEGFVLDEPTPDPDPGVIGRPFAVKREQRQGAWGLNPQLDGLFSGRTDITDFMPADVAYNFGQVVGFAEPEKEKARAGNALMYSVMFGMPKEIAFDNQDSLNKEIFGKALSPTAAWRTNQGTYTEIKKTLGEKLKDFGIKDFLSKVPFSPFFDYEKKEAGYAKVEIREIDWGPLPVTKTGTERTKEILKQAQDKVDVYAEKSRRGQTIAASIFDGVTMLPAYMMEFYTGGALAKVIGLPYKGIKGAFAASAVRTTIQPHRVASSIIDQRAKGEKPASALFKAYGDVYIENLSEAAGGAVVPILKKLPFGSKLTAAMIRMGKKLKIPESQIISRMAQKGGWNGLVGEWGEERLATELRAIFDVEDFGAGPDSSIPDRMVAGFLADMTLENQLIELGVLSVPFGARMIASKVIGPDAVEIEKPPTVEEEPTAKEQAQTAEEEAAQAEHMAAIAHEGLKEGEPAITPAKAKQPWETSDLATAPNIPVSTVKAEKQVGGKWKLMFRGTRNEVFQGELFDSAAEAKRFFKVQQIKAQEAAITPKEGEVDIDGISVKSTVIKEGEIVRDKFFDTIETKDLPPVKEGDIRLYRGQSPIPREGAGAFYTPFLNHAYSYAQEQGKDWEIAYIDVPKEIANKYASTKIHKEFLGMENIAQEYLFPQLVTPAKAEAPVAAEISQVPAQTRQAAVDLAAKTGKTQYIRKDRDWHTKGVPPKTGQYFTVTPEGEITFTPDGPQKVTKKAKPDVEKLSEKAKVLSRHVHPLTSTQEAELDRIEAEIDKKSKRLISKEAYEKAKKRITDRDVMRTGLDPQGFVDMVTIGAYHIESGIRNFADWSKKMIEEFGTKIKPNLKSIWDESNEMSFAKDLEKQILLDGLEAKWEKERAQKAKDPTHREWLDQFEKYDDIKLGVPDDIHHEELTFAEDVKKPAAEVKKKSIGLTRAEIGVFGPEFGSLARWAQAHGEPIGYKKGVADKTSSARQAIDRLRMASKIRQHHRADAANLVYTYVPRQYRGDFIKRAMAIRTPLNAERFADAIELWVKEHEFREAIKRIKKLKKAVEKDTKYGETKYGKLPPGLREKVKSLLDYDMAKLTDMKKKRLTSRKQWLDRIASTVIGGLTEMPLGINEKLADDYKDFTVINQNLIDEMHRLEQQNIHEISIEQINSAVEQVEKLLLEHAKKGQSRFRRRFEKWHKKKTSAVNEIFQQKTKEKWTKAIGWVKEAATVDQYNIRSLVGSASGLESENMMDLLYDALVEGNHERVKLYKKSVEAWQKEAHAAKISDADFDSLEELVTITIGGKELELSRDDLLTIYGYTIADGTLKRLLTTDGLNIITHRLKGIKGAFGMTTQEYRVDTPSVQELRNIADQVLPAHKKLLDIHFKIAREHGAPAINKVSVELQNAPIADTREDARYLAVHREFSNRFSGEKMTDTAKATEMLGRFQPRKGGKQRMNIRPFTQEVMSGQQANALYSSMTIPMMEARSLLASRDYTDKMQKYGHKKVLENLSTIYNRMLAYGTDAATMDLVFASFFSQAGKSILSLRLTGAAIQTASISASYGVIDRKYFLYRKPTKAEIIEMEEKYPSLWLRWKGRQFDYALGTLTAARGFKTMIMETRDLTDKFLDHYTWGDQFAIYNILKAAERMTSEKYKPGTKEYETVLNKTFDRAMETQPMWDMLHRSKLTSDTGFFAKGFTMFMSARNAQLNVIVQAIIDKRRGRITKSERNWRIAHIGQAALTVSFIRQMIRKGIQIAGIGFFTAVGLRPPPDEEEIVKIVKDLAIKLPTETIFNLTGLNVVGSVINAAVIGGIRASNYKWGAYDARNLRTGNFGVDIFVDMMTTGIEGVEFITDLLTLRESRTGEFAFYDSGERFIRDIMVLTAYRLGLPLMGPMSDIYYPMKRAYNGSKGKGGKVIE